MSKVLLITANPKREENSFSLSAGRKFINLYKENNPKDEVVEIDVYNSSLPLIDEDVLNGWWKLQSGKSFNDLSDVEKEKVGTINKLTDEFIEADKYVFVTPLFNFTVPPMMKAYLDAICIAGRTFKYTENGPVGLLSEKKAVHIQASGGFYSDESTKEMELGNRYIKLILSFIGINDVESILIEGTAVMSAEDVKNKAENRIIKVANGF